jgi:hypothetical protein
MDEDRAPSRSRLAMLLGGQRCGWPGGGTNDPYKQIALIFGIKACA